MLPQTRYRNPDRDRKDKPLQLDEDGFLIDTDAWSIETSRLMAEMDGIGSLGPDHLAVIAYLRDMYMQTGGLPVMSRICRSLNLAKHGVHALFGSCCEAWRIAGLPNPGEEAKTYMT